MRIPTLSLCLVSWMAVSFALFPGKAAGDTLLDKVELAKWYEDRKAAVSLRFDDSLECHVTQAVPILNRYGIKATFMVNPGTRRYQKFKEFWEKDVPGAGHKLGNHTMHHRGAVDLEDAKFEIGEVSRLIWRIHPEGSRLHVFASGGGGKKWGGKDWKYAGTEYKELLRTYKLIDLYDGKHPFYSVDRKAQVKDLRGIVEKAISNGAHQAFTFHNIGKSGFKDYLKYLWYGYDLTCSEETLDGFAKYLADSTSAVWVAPLDQIYKYETEFGNTSVSTVSEGGEKVSISLNVLTDVTLYDQRLTVLVRLKRARKIKGIFQDGVPLNGYGLVGKVLKVNVAPKSGRIVIEFEQPAAEPNGKAGNNA